MKSFIQVAVAFLLTGWLAHYLHGTPLYHWMVFLPLFVGAMYAVALVQHRLHWRFSRRGRPMTPGARANGTERTFRSPMSGAWD